MDFVQIIYELIHLVFSIKHKTHREYHLHTNKVCKESIQSYLTLSNNYSMNTSAVKRSIGEPLLHHLSV